MISMFYVLSKVCANGDRREFKGHLKDDWTLPGANFEMACIAWKEKDVPGVDHNAKVKECEQWVDKTKNWGEQYLLDSRVIVKIRTSQFTIKRHKRVMGI